MALGREQRKYLAILAEHNTSVRLNIISSRMGCTSPRNISECIEPYLIRAGLITKLDSGRILTAAGLEYVRTHVRANDEN
jgi:Holliday junction resolvasome RuvABC ATP-dependent DNA helicase subunit